MPVKELFSDDDPRDPSFIVSGRDLHQEEDSVGNQDAFGYNSVLRQGVGNTTESNNEVEHQPYSFLSLQGLNMRRKLVSPPVKKTMMLDQKET